MRCAGRNPNERPVWSDSFDWPVGGGGGDSFKMDFLKKAFVGMARPMLKSLKFRIRITATTAGGASLRADCLPSILERLFIKDAHGERVDLSGMALARLMQVERRVAFFGRDLAVDGAGQTRDLWLEVPIEPWTFCKDPHEWRWNAARLVKGEISFNWKAGTTLGEAASLNLATVTAANIRCFAQVVDEGAGAENHKIRAVWKEFNINSNDTQYPVVGFPRYVYQYIGRVGDTKATRDTWDEQQLTSTVLDLSAVDDNYLTELDLERRQIRRTAPNLDADEDDGVVLGVLQPLYTQNFEAAITELPKVDTLDHKTTLDMGAGITATDKPSILVSWVIKRPNQCHGKAPAGVVKTADGLKAVSSIPADYQAVLPIVTPPGALGPSALSQL